MAGPKTDIARNKKAARDYHVTDKLEAGIELRGTEVKSIREGNVNIGDAFARIENGQLFLYGCDIMPWQTAAAFFQHAAKRPRRLLVHKSEITKFDQMTSQKGFTIICTRMYFKGNRVKVEVGLAKGKTHGDQRHDLRKKQEMREAQREVSRINRR